MTTKRRWQILVLALALFAIPAAVPQFRDAVRQWYIWHSCQPYEEFRNATAKVKLADVKSIEIESPFRSPVVVTDKATQGLLLRGLQVALMPPQFYKYRVDNAILVSHNGTRLGRFAFSTRREVDAFSPPFVEGLRKAGIRVPN